MMVLLLMLAAILPAAAQGQMTASFASARRTFSCDTPKGWPVFEEDTPGGFAAHFLGPAEAGGAYRAAIHVRYFEKGQPGFVPIDDALKRERQPDKLTERSATSVARWRVARNTARRFEVTETRQLPPGLLPSQAVLLHHYYAFVASGEGYYIIKLSSTRERYLDYKDDWEKLLATFRIIGE